MAKITFDGNIGKDAVLRTVQNGDRQDKVLSVWVAENILKRNKTTETKWHKVTIWRGYAETMAPYLKSGRHILVEGNAKASFYTNQAGQIIPYIDIQATTLKLLDAKREEDVPPEVEATEEAPVDEAPWMN